MAIDARPSVTVVGVVNQDVGGTYISLDAWPSADFLDGDDVEVTIRHHEWTAGGLFLDPDEADE